MSRPRRPLKPARALRTAARRALARAAAVAGAGLVAALVVAASPVRAEADGPDHFVVRGVARGDVLNVRAQPSARAARVGALAPGTRCVRNLGCQGGPTLREFVERASGPASPPPPVAAPRWCRIEHRGTRGWVLGRHLAEDGCAR